MDNKNQDNTNSNCLSSFRSSHLCKTIAYILIFAFVLYDITWAQGGTPIWHDAKPDMAINGKPTLDGIKVPYNQGIPQEVLCSARPVLRDTPVAIQIRVRIVRQHLRQPGGDVQCICGRHPFQCHLTLIVSVAHVNFGSY